MKSTRPCLLACLAAVSTLLLSPGAEATLLLNGDFESGTTGWTVTTNSGGFGVSGGAFWGYDNVGHGTLSQTFATTPGQNYDFSFYSSSSIDPGNILRYQFDSGSIETVTTTTSMVQSIGAFTATGPTSTLQFYFETDDGTGTWSIDDVVVTPGSFSAVPEPGSLLALGALVGCGTFMRSRRTRSITRSGKA